MLEVKIDIIPFGLSSNRETINTIQIINNGTNNGDYGNYDVIYNNIKYPQLVMNWLRSKGAMALIGKIINILEEIKCI